MTHADKVREAARASTVDRAGRKHEVRRKQQSARERLLNYIRPDREAIPPEDDPRFMATVRRLLRAHERELLGGRVVTMTVFVCGECDVTAADEDGCCVTCGRDCATRTVRAAILGQPRAKKGARR